MDFKPLSLRDVSNGDLRKHLGEHCPNSPVYSSNFR